MPSPLEMMIQSAGGGGPSPTAQGDASMQAKAMQAMQQQMKEQQVSQQFTQRLYQRLNPRIGTAQDTDPQFQAQMRQKQMVALMAKLGGMPMGGQGAY